MKMVLHGYKHMEGDFNGIKYNNYKLHCSDFNLTPNMVGKAVNQVKVTPQVFHEFIAGKTDEMVLEKVIDIEFGMNNVVQSIRLAK